MQLGGVTGRLDVNGWNQTGEVVVGEYLKVRGQRLSPELLEQLLADRNRQVRAKRKPWRDWPSCRRGRRPGG